MPSLWAAMARDGCIKEGVSRAQTRYFGGTEHFYQTNISTLAAAISQSKMHMQFVMFDDCYMSNIEVA